MTNMRTNEMTPAPLQRAGGQAISGETAAAPDLTALQRHARSVIVGMYRHRMEREQWVDRLPRLL